jgi:hypothetical protein
MGESSRRIFGNEIADRLAKEATQNKYVTYRRITKSAVKRIRGKKAQENGKVNGRKQRKGAITKEFFPSVERRLAVNLNRSLKVTTIMTGHRNIRSYLHRLKIIGSPECPCKNGIRTVDHLIFQHNRLKNERKTLKTSVLKVGNWLVSKSEPTNRYLKQFI